MSINKKIQQIKVRLSKLIAARKKEEEKTQELFSKLYSQLDSDYEKLVALVRISQYELAVKRYNESVHPEDIDTEEEEDLDNGF